jgi:hypothetical protein
MPLAIMRRIEHRRKTGVDVLRSTGGLLEFSKPEMAVVRGEMEKHG